MTLKIAIIGCGYLGMAVASRLQKRGYFVTATTRTPARLDALGKVAQKAVLLREADETTLALLAQENDALILTLAADHAQAYESTYLSTAQALRKIAPSTSLPRTVIYTSSTAVYGDHKGQWVDENSPCSPPSDTAAILLETENVLLSLTEYQWTVCLLRLAEIYGPGRELSQKVAQLSGKNAPGTGSQHTNMIHRDDAASAIEYALVHKLRGIYNLSDDDHPTRKEFYAALAKQASLPAPSWDPSLPSMRLGDKRISNHKIKAAGFQFSHPHRF
jgi:nucleoside-diphosphate-sugar epimerase